MVLPAGICAVGEMRTGGIGDVGGTVVPFPNHTLLYYDFLTLKLRLLFI